MDRPGSFHSFSLFHFVIVEVETMDIGEDYSFIQVQREGSSIQKKENICIYFY